MQRFLLFIIAAAAALGAMAEAVAVYPRPVHNFGAFAEDDGPVTCKFPIVNAGDEPLVIVSVRASCGCTQPKYPHDAVAPGDTAYIDVTYDPSYRPGRFEKAVTVETNTNPSRAKLLVKGTVIGSAGTIASRYPVEMGPLKFENPSAMMGDVTLNNYHTTYMRFYNRSEDSVHVVTSAPAPYLDTNFSPNPVPPGEQGSLTVVYTGYEGGVYGFVEDSVMIAIEGGEPMAIPVDLNIGEDFSKLSDADRAKAPVVALNPENCDFGIIHNRHKTLDATVTLTNRGATTLEIRRIYSLDPGVEASAAATSVKPGESTEITVTVDPMEQKGGMVNAKLNIITNDPAQPVRTVRLTGEFAVLQRVNRNR